MRGHLEERGKDRWRAKVYLGAGPNGTKRYLTRTIHGPKRHAENVLAQLIVEAGAGGHDVTDGTVEELARRWIEAAGSGLSPTTLRGYEQLLRTAILPRIGRMKLRAVRPQTLDQLAGPRRGPYGEARQARHRRARRAGPTKASRRGNVAWLADRHAVGGGEQDPPRHVILTGLLPWSFQHLGSAPCHYFGSTAASGPRAITLQGSHHRQCPTPILGDGKAVAQPLMNVAGRLSVRREVAASRGCNLVGTEHGKDQTVEGVDAELVTASPSRCVRREPVAQSLGPRRRLCDVLVRAGVQHISLRIRSLATAPCAPGACRKAPRRWRRR